MSVATAPVRYRAYTRATLPRHPAWRRLSPAQREAIDVVSRVLPFRVNDHVLEQLIDWARVPEDPIFQLTFPQRGMLAPADWRRLRDLVAEEAPKDVLGAAVADVRARLQPHPAGQQSHNVPTFEGRPLAGVQHKYPETVLFFPAAGQTCHAYCAYCFRWAQFVGDADLRFAAPTSARLASYLRAHPEVSDVLVTGGDPLIMKTAVLRRLLEPLLAVPTVRHLRLGTKAVAYWPQRFVTDDDAEELLRFVESVVAGGREVAMMLHLSHPRELEPPVARQALRRLRDAGATLRLQAPMIRRVNDDPAVWASLWRTAVGLGIVPYYLFVERDTGPRRYFELPLARVHEIFRDAYARVTGLARTVRGPVMSAFPGKVRILGTAEAGGERVFVLDLLQARDPAWVRRPFLARWDPAAVWLDDLRPAGGAERFFFETAPEPASTVDS